MSRVTKPVVVLFDVDETLVHTGGSGARSWKAAFEKLYDIPAGIGEHSSAGETDPQVTISGSRNSTSNAARSAGTTRVRDAVRCARLANVEPGVMPAPPGAGLSTGRRTLSGSSLSCVHRLARASSKRCWDSSSGPLLPIPGLTVASLPPPAPPG